MKLNSLFVFVFSVVFVYTNAHVVHDTSPKQYEVFSPADKTKWIQVSQLEHVFQSIDERLRRLVEKQSQDSNSIPQISGKLEQIDEQLHNLLNRLDKLEQRESYNQLLYSRVTQCNAKVEIDIDYLKHKIDLNQQQTNSRLSEIDAALEKIHGDQMNHLQKEIRRINTAQDKLISTVGELAENSKLDATKLEQVLNKTRQQLREEFADAVQNITNSKEGNGVVKIQDASAYKPNMNVKQNQNDVISSELNDKYNNLQEEIGSIQQTVAESLAVGNKIYEKLEEDKKDIDTYMESLLHAITAMKEKSETEFQELKTQLSANSSKILGEQINFKRNCSRLQLHEEHLEDKTVTILRVLINLITNRTNEIREDFARKSAAELDHFSQQVDEIEQLRLILNNQAEQIQKIAGQGLLNATTELSTPTALKKMYNTTNPSPTFVNSFEEVVTERHSRVNERKENSRTTKRSPFDSRRVSTTSATVINESEEELSQVASTEEPLNDFTY